MFQLPILRGGALAALGLVLGTDASAQVLEQCHTDSIPLQLTNWSHSLTVPKFDPDLGILVGIRFELTGIAEGAARFESLDAAPATVTTSFQTTVSLTRPDNSLIVVVTPAQQWMDSVTAYDGITDFDGTSGKTYRNVLVSETEIVNSPPPPGDLALFTGPNGNPGTITLPVSAAGTSMATGAGNIITQFFSEAEASVLVCYLYMPDCNGNGIPDETDILLGTSNDHDLDGIPDECQPSTEVFCVPEGAQGNGIECPCGNNVPPNAIEGCDNGTGTGGSLTAAGVPSIANDTLVLTASQIPLTSPGFFFAGNAVLGSGQGLPFDSGLRCIGGAVPIRKLPMNSGGGTLPVPPNGPSVSALVSAQAGTITYFQFWYRNPGGPCGGNANPTNGIKVVWGL